MPPPPSRPMTLTEWALLLALSLIWGGSFFLAKVAVVEVPPLTLVLARVGLAALALHALLRLRGLASPTGRDLLAAFLVMGLLNNVVPFSLIFWGQTAIPSGLASILNATTPLWTALLAHALVPGERLTVSKLAGVAVGLAGVAVLIGPQALSGLEGATLAMLAIVGAALSYALSAIYARRFRSTPPLVTAAGQLTASTLMMIPLALAVDQPWTLAMPSPGVMGAVLGLALVSTAFAYLLYFRILAGAGATNAALVTFLVPVSAILLGALFLDERLAPRAFAGMALILAGLVAIDGRAATRLQGKARALRKPELS